MADRPGDDVGGGDCGVEVGEAVEVVIQHDLTTGALAELALQNEEASNHVRPHERRLAQELLGTGNDAGMQHLAQTARHKTGLFNGFLSLQRKIEGEQDHETVHSRNSRGKGIAKEPLLFLDRQEVVHHIDAQRSIAGIDIGQVGAPASPNDNLAISLANMTAVSPDVLSNQTIRLRKKGQKNAGCFVKDTFDLIIDEGHDVMWSRIGFTVRLIVQCIQGRQSLKCVDCGTK